MKQTYIINNCKSFRVKDVFDCGQCFRWNEELDKSYTGIFGKNVLNVKQMKKDTKLHLQEYAMAT